MSKRRNGLATAGSVAAVAGIGLGLVIAAICLWLFFFLLAAMFWGWIIMLFAGAIKPHWGWGYWEPSVFPWGALTAFVFMLFSRPVHVSQG